MKNVVQIHVIENSTQDNTLNFTVMAAFMESGRVLDRASSLLLIVAALACLPRVSSAQLTAACLVLNLILALAAKYYGWRVALDAELFKVLARHADWEAIFDEVLAACLGKKANGVRSAASRWQGAKQLLRTQGVFVAMQGMSTILAVLSRLILM